jgi:hypothetical protein
MKPPAITISFTVAEARFIVELADRLRSHSGVDPASDTHSLVKSMTDYIESHPGSNNRAIAKAHGLQTPTVKNYFGPKLKREGYTCGRGRFAHWRKPEANGINGKDAIRAISKTENRAMMKSSSA